MLLISIYSLLLTTLHCTYTVTIKICWCPWPKCFLFCIVISCFCVFVSLCLCVSIAALWTALQLKYKNTNHPAWVSGWVFIHIHKQLLTTGPSLSHHPSQDPGVWSHTSDLIHDFSLLAALLLFNICTWFQLMMRIQDNKCEKRGKDDRNVTHIYLTSQVSDPGHVQHY